MQRDRRRRWRRMRRPAPTGAACVLLLTAAACTGGSGGPTPSATTSNADLPQTSLARVAVDLPGPVTALTAADAGLILGTYAVSATPRAGLTLLTPTTGAAGGAPRVMPVDAVTPYGREGSWQALAADGTHLIGIAGERGGAHGNVRWTIWRGEVSAAGGRMAEEKQEFWTFGGYDMGGLSGVGFGAGRPVVVGGWKSADTGLDIATWAPRGHTWVRADSARTALASTTFRLVAATAVISTGRSVLLLGSTTLLGRGGVSVIPSVWATPEAPLPNSWRRSDLPTAAGSGAGSVEAGGCAGSECLLAGRVAGRLALWRWDGQTATPVPAPDVTLGDPDRIVGAGLVGARPWLAIARSAPPTIGAPSTATSAAAESLAGEVLHSADPVTASALDWRLEKAPGGGRPTAAGVAGGRFWVATDQPALWVTP